MPALPLFLSNDLIAACVSQNKGQVFNDESYQLTGKMIELNPDFYSLWNFRRDILDAFFKAEPACVLVDDVLRVVLLTRPSWFQEEGDSVCRGPDADAGCAHEEPKIVRFNSCLCGVELTLPHACVATARGIIERGSLSKESRASSKSWGCATKCWSWIREIVHALDPLVSAF
jgi:hypothetical protein